jgi:signal transduction histidine kinase
MTGSDISSFDKLNRENNRGFCMKQNRDLILRLLLGKYLEEEKKEISIGIIEKLMTTISYYLGDPLTIILGKTELLEESLKNRDLQREEIADFLSLCRDQLTRITLVLNTLHSLTELRYRNYPLGIEMIDIEDKIKFDPGKNLNSSELDQDVFVRSSAKVPRNRLGKTELYRKERG